MSHWKPKPKNSRTLENFGLTTTHTVPDTPQSEFYELELGAVLDVVMDSTGNLGVEWWSDKYERKEGCGGSTTGCA